VVTIGSGLATDAKVYFYLSPCSYTGEDVAEIHLRTNPSVTGALMVEVLKRRDVGVRMAGPGEFTARAYLNGKMDLTQAEAVNEIVVSSNAFQLAAAEKLLAGRLAETTARVRGDILDCLSLIEAGLDFSQEGIDFISRSDAVRGLDETRGRLQQLLSGGIIYESVIGLPAVGIAGAPNAGKSSLVNRLLGEPRSIVSEQPRTTRDVLSGLLALEHFRCVLFDCAGLIRSPTSVLDELAQQAAAEALRNSSVVVFCVDVSKAQYAEDLAVRGLIEAEVFIPVATKCDVLETDSVTERVSELNDLFGAEFIPASSKTGSGVGRLRDEIDGKISEVVFGSSAYAGPRFAEGSQDGLVLTVRHKQAVLEAIESISESVEEIEAGNEEVAAMLLRAAYQSLATVAQQHIDEQILERIFERFCIGK
jgi:tRNA modification GTPase